MLCHICHRWMFLMVSFAAHTASLYDFSTLPLNWFDLAWARNVIRHFRSRLLVHSLRRPRNNHQGDVRCWTEKMLSGDDGNNFLCAETETDRRKSGRLHVDRKKLWLVRKNVFISTLLESSLVVLVVLTKVYEWFHINLGILGVHELWTRCKAFCAVLLELFPMILQNFKKEFGNWIKPENDLKEISSKVWAPLLIRLRLIINQSMTQEPPQKFTKTSFPFHQITKAQWFIQWSKIIHSFIKCTDTDEPFAPLTDGNMLKSSRWLCRWLIRHASADVEHLPGVRSESSLQSPSVDGVQEQHELCDCFEATRR